jgi:deoxyribose-phosphate aldolase
MKKIEFQNTDETASNLEILSVLKEVEKFEFITKIGVLPHHVKLLRNKLSNKNIKLSSIVDFPLGILSTKNRLDIIKQSIRDGANSIEIVMPSFLINNKQNAKIKKDIQDCYELCMEYGVDLHYILEYRLYNYSCLSRLVKVLLSLNLNDIYISTGFRLDDIHDHVIAMAMILKENENAKIICNANIFNKEHLNILQSSNLHHFRVNNLNILSLIREKYQI